MIGLDDVMSADNAFSPAFVMLDMKAPSPAPLNFPPASENDDLDGCGLPVEVPTPDDELPAAEGGVA